jgi:Tol biopolymer transport system component
MKRQQLFHPCVMGAFLLAFLAAGLMEVRGQYFGQNRVRYETFDFKVLKTEHFDIHYYDEKEEIIEEVGQMLERWYLRLSRVLEHDLSDRQPIILYANHPHFRQTNAIPGDVGETTGGVTELFKRRIVMPLSGPLAESDHVLGHELVHAFQFDITGQGRTTIGMAVPGALRLPLWFIEGMAEYLSLGPVDPNTAMWMRDAVLREQLPTVRDLGHPRYFPYRFGQAFWAYVGGRYGDQSVGRMLKIAGRTGNIEGAINQVLGITSEELSGDWHEALRAQYEAVLEATQPPGDQAQVLIAAAEGRQGRINVSPSLSPDGRYVVFFSERALFSIDMFLADANTGQVIRRVTRTATDPHFESLQFINSAGAWSSDSSRLAFGVISRGRPLIAIYDVERNSVIQEIPLPGLGEVFNPTWSPDDRKIAFSAIAGGLTNLYVVDIETEEMRALTNDAFAALHPDWSPDGRRIVFVTDRFTSDLATLNFGHYRLAFIDPDSGAIEQVPAFETGKHINPQWSADGNDLFFISDHNGISNIFRLDLRTRQTHQVTHLQTGATGITALSPALSVAANTNRIAFSVFDEGNYSLFVIEPERAMEARPSLASLPELNPALLPPRERTAQVVTALLQTPQLGIPPTTAFETSDYKAGLSLDYVAQPDVSVGISSFGSFIGGGTGLFWSDMLGNHNLATIFQVNAYDGSFLNNLTALIGYENRRTRWNWGFMGGQVPYLTGGFGQRLETIEGQTVLTEEEVRFWQINREIAAQFSYPFSRAQRIEFSTGFRNLDFVAQTRSRSFSTVTGRLVADRRESLPAPDSLNMGTGSAALVYDTSLFGGTSPVMGQRYRLELGGVGGDINYSQVLTDYRRYFMIRQPLTLAGRFLHFGRYFGDGEDPRLQDLFIGYPSLVRGYDYGSFQVNECIPDATSSCPVFDQLLGSRMAVANLELRTALLGALGVLRSPGFPPIEAAVFFDAGTAWTRAQTLDIFGGDRHPVTSHGVTMRINLLGFAVAQINYVHPNHRPLRNWIWEFSLTPGF